MTKLLISWIIIPLIIIIHLKIISSDTICYEMNYLKEFCKTDNHELMEIESEDLPVQTDLDVLNFSDNDIKIIVDNVFNDNESPVKLTTLILELSNENIIIEPYAFANLTKLENLEITSGPIQLDPYTFQELSSLLNLKLKINEEYTKIHQVLPNFPELERLELLDNDTIGICDEFEGFLKLAELHYTGGNIFKISRISLACLKDLEKLVITGTHLSDIDNDAFEDLKKLKIISITGNRHLKYFPTGAFGSLEGIKIFDVSNNSLDRIPALSNHPAAAKNCLLVNLSYNSIETLTNRSFSSLQCHVVDLSRNKIDSIVNDEFKNSMIDTIFMNDNLINNFVDDKQWGLRNNTRVHFKIMTKEIAENKNRSTRGINCYCSNNFIFEICLADNILASVKEIFIRDDVKTLNILDNRISRIGYAAFSAIPHIENLIIISAAKNFEIRRNSFEGLSNLKSLKLITTPIILYSFELLKNLKYLELIPQGILSCDLISELENLNVFGIINSTECQFKCYRQCISDTFDESKFLSLYYKGGSFKKVPAKAFSCLNRVNKIIITSSDLEIIEPEAFDGLQNLETLAITWNNNFTRIEKNVFSNFANLKSLILSHNSISFIDDGGLKTIKSEVHNSKLSYLDLSYNKLKYIESPIFGDTIITELKIDNTKMINKNDKFENVRTIFAVNDLTVVNDLSAVQTKSCHDQGFFKICAKKNIITDVYLNINNYELSLPDYENNLSVDLHLNLSLDTDELSIGKNAFKNIERDCSIKTLTISKSHSSGIEFFYYTFFGLSNLENIIFNVGPIEVVSHQFQLLINLKTMKIEVDERSQYLGEVLLDLMLLKNLEIIKNNSVGICTNLSAENFLSITTLSYTGGRIKVLPGKSLICSPRLVNLKITHTKLEKIETNAFYGLDDLKTINLAYNKIFYITTFIFNDKLTKLETIELNNNQISHFDYHVFTTSQNINLPYRTLKLVNISNNQLSSSLKPKTFDGIICKVFDMTGSGYERNAISLFGDSCIEYLMITENLEFLKTCSSTALNSD